MRRLSDHDIAALGAAGDDALSLEPGRADYFADANPEPARVRHGAPASRAERRNAERAARAAAKREKRRLFWKGVKAGDRPYTPTSKAKTDADL